MDKPKYPLSFAEGAVKMANALHQLTRNWMDGMERYCSISPFCEAHLRVKVMDNQIFFGG